MARSINPKRRRDAGSRLMNCLSDVRDLGEAGIFVCEFQGECRGRRVCCSSRIVGAEAR